MALLTSRASIAPATLNVNYRSVGCGDGGVPTFDKERAKFRAHCMRRRSRPTMPGSIPTRFVETKLATNREALGFGCQSGRFHEDHQPALQWNVTVTKAAVPHTLVEDRRRNGTFVSRSPRMLPQCSSNPGPGHYDTSMPDTFKPPKSLHGMTSAVFASPRSVSRADNLDDARGALRLPAGGSKLPTCAYICSPSRLSTLVLPEYLAICPAAQRPTFDI
eukprot:gnl/TRDRNA2_/TRDRNA2_74264_c0_seq1.p1 gnl/TRDRNA2_/TRDRNA2_74264_c0~~gnl/TRDRNA2_/TRDRNA2_74264_c0_seq1.p1  ORF type:complete len:219 (-),score=18.69 gnl/TRDRNA2_/TRDRNA2_74264_c0_seq1:142-798(-)